MPVALKNNSLIVKDSKVAENCDCCGGWYCCPGYPYWSSGSLSGCDPREYISSVSVTIETGADWSRNSSESYGCGYTRIYRKDTAIIPTSHYAGTFSLLPSGPSGKFLYEYEPDEADGIATISASVYFTGDGRLSWGVTFMGNCYIWAKYSRSEVSDTKSLSDMKTAFTSTGSALNCYASGYEYYSSGPLAASVGGVTSLCQSAYSFTGSSVATLYGCTVSRSSDEKSGLGGDFGTGATTESGSRQIRISVEAS